MHLYKNEDRLLLLVTVFYMERETSFLSIYVFRGVNNW
jgi:hypothetical protein